MALINRDAHTGRDTTGHSWDGIEELDSPIPRAVVWSLALTAVFSVICWILMPAWPTVTTSTRGLLGIDERAALLRADDGLTTSRTAVLNAILAAPIEQVLDDARLVGVVRDVASPLFADNCAACHGVEGRGGPSFPNIRSAPLAWGDNPKTIEETLRVGINSAHPESRTAQMPAYGRDKTLTREEIGIVTAFVQGLGHSTRDETPTGAKGRELFAANCAACHGERGLGNQELGAPNLADQNWLYGGDADAIRATLTHGRQGRMPNWDKRLTAAERRALALYVVDLRRRP